MACVLAAVVAVAWLAPLAPHAPSYAVRHAVPRAGLDDDNSGMKDINKSGPSDARSAQIEKLMAKMRERGMGTRRVSNCRLLAYPTTHNPEADRS